MKLSDIMSGMRLEAYAEVALLIFFAVFMLVLLQVVLGKNKEQWQRARYLPLDDRRPHPLKPRGHNGV